MVSKKSVRLSVPPSVCPSLRPSVRLSVTNRAAGIHMLGTELKLGTRGYKGKRLRFGYGELVGNSGSVEGRVVYSTAGWLINTTAGWLIALPGG